MPETVAVRIKTCQPVVGPQPQVAFLVLTDGVDGVPGISLFPGKPFELFCLRVEKVQPVFGPDPDPAVRRPEDGHHGVVADGSGIVGIVPIIGKGFRCLVESGKSVSPGGEPQITVAALLHIP